MQRCSQALSPAVCGAEYSTSSAVHSAMWGTVAAHDSAGSVRLLDMVDGNHVAKTLNAGANSQPIAVCAGACGTEG